MTWVSILGLVSLTALFIPIIFLLALRLGRYRTFPALLIYYSLIFLYNLYKQGFVPVDRELVVNWNIINNLLDAPLILIFLAYFSTSASLTRWMHRFVFLFVVFELVVIALVGFNTQAITITLAPGIISVLAFSLHFFIRQTKITILHRKATGKAIITAALLFAYGCYSLIYVMYYVLRTPYIADTFIVYFLVVTFSSLLLSVGILIERKRIQKLNELILTRRELSIVYREANPSGPARKAMLDFDKEHWR